MMVRSSTDKGTASSNHVGDSSGSESRDSDLEVEGLVKTFAKCKWFNVAKGFGFVSLEDPSTVIDEDNKDKPPPDIFVYQTAIKMRGFRSLKEGEKVEVWYKKSDKGLEAVKVAGPEGSYCIGSEKRPKRRKKAADRCYNCDERGHHAKECKLPPLPKRCHHCKSVDHLVADCTSKRDKPVYPTQSDNSSNLNSSDTQRASETNNDTSQSNPDAKQTNSQLS